MGGYLIPSDKVITVRDGEGERIKEGEGECWVNSIILFATSRAMLSVGLRRNWNILFATFRHAVCRVATKLLFYSPPPAMLCVGLQRNRNIFFLLLTQQPVYTVSTHLQYEFFIHVCQLYTLSLTAGLGAPMPNPWILYPCNFSSPQYLITPLYFVQ
jgi:hypothetical protein